MIIGVTGWLLSCGHTIRFTSDELQRSQDLQRRGAGLIEPPRRPRMCPVCQKPRNVVSSAAAAE